MAKHGSKGTKSRKRLVKKVKQAIANEKLSIKTGSAHNRLIRQRRGEDIKKDFKPGHPINKKPSPGIRARVRNLERHGEAVPTFTGGKLDKGGPIKRARVKFQKFKNVMTAKSTAKVVAKNKKVREKEEFKGIMTQINRMRNKRFRKEQENRVRDKRKKSK